MAKSMTKRLYVKIYRRLRFKKYFSLVLVWFIIGLVCLCIFLAQSHNRRVAANASEQENHNVSSPKYSQKDLPTNSQLSSNPNEISKGVQSQGVSKEERESQVEERREANSQTVPLFLGDNRSQDEEKEELFLFVAITTDHKNFQARQSVRDTWLQFPRIPSWEAYFFVMQSPNITLQRWVEEEAKQFKDIIILPYLETYANLTLKTLSLMEWIDQNINATFIFKSDDDAYVNIPRLALWLLKKPLQRFYTGGVNKNSKPVRIKGHKWYVSYDEYPYKYYPDYCIGNGYIVSSDLVSILGNCLPENLSCTNDYPSCVPRKSCSVPLQFYRVIGLEDITVAIILKGSAGVECVHGDGKFINEPYFYCNTKYSPRCLMGLKEPEDQNVVCNPRYEVFFIHRVVPEQMYRYHFNGPGIGANIKMCKNSSFSSYPLL
ncbi:beta-1,3-galactosyltransferase 1 [Galdieria sulphuraria]|uniref:Hexosyltransferase n=1 Tax=Galdieria sulphuraria TaxID=130081 RepID=M2XV69_GALSU|nr:beta-1,3-galactosyltransferase 1 [Galdieria sulphuraria]EME27553.1 beta-1,3-galactosyltransferase 1 [Galdieria sulphuraria]|eukprot:XP_005704073.1 beta-1,3-galactosyltransferase 1 [Galdieria sulphuraria]